MNGNERFAAETLRSEGFEVIRNGWPDFLVVNQTWDEAFALEWKEPGDTVHEHQDAMHRALRCHFGLSTLVTGSIDDVLKFRPPSQFEAAALGAVRVRDQVRAETLRLRHEADRLQAFIGGAQ
jgi:hypothetical protein